ncbi:hypothetical protein WV31_18535 [Magnetospirillum sp. ME-1]|uniref:YjgN family protein n=1 Tax=Magnetospirillum sp. ME-1 TaxID=1639348 RepID=UPI000A17E1A1|nr:YjgN family protein [Magnetospirillum sp. ME-1]ARJ67512.1 hypothetical protein WV31_18535 [Magnetospirillum sp. ME-1]
MNGTATIQRPFAHSAGTGGMIRLALVNLLLSILTLSLYRFWGKTRVRRLLWGGTRAWGDPVEYTGTGKELFLGFLLALGVIYLPLTLGFIGGNVLLQSGNPLGGALIAALYFLTVMLVAAGLFRARRYQMSRTVWRGIRGGQTGSALSYAFQSLVVWILVPASLGWALPWGDMMLARYRLGNTTFGDRGLTVKDDVGSLYKTFAGAWVAYLLGGPVVLLCVGGWSAAMAAMDLPPIVATLLGGLGVIVALLFAVLPYAWYKAAFYRHLASRTSFCGAAFVAEVKDGALIRLVLGNLLITSLSLGILRPWASLRTFRYVCAVIGVEGEPDFASVHRSDEAGPSTGEGLVAVLDGAGEF